MTKWKGNKSLWWDGMTKWKGNKILWSDGMQKKIRIQGKQLIKTWDWMVEDIRSKFLTKDDQPSLYMKMKT